MTINQRNALRAAAEAGCNLTMTARRLGISRSAAWWWVKKVWGLPTQPRGRPKGQQWPYNTYRFTRRTDGTCAAYGSARECAAQLGVTTKYLYILASNARKGLTPYTVEIKDRQGRDKTGPKRSDEA